MVHKFFGESESGWILGDSEPETSSWFIFKYQTINYGELKVSVVAENANGAAYL